MATQPTNPRFSTNEVTVVFFLGGPGSGKSTQSANLVKDYGFVQLSIGDLLRVESQHNNMIRQYIREGKIVPKEMTVSLLSNAMADSLKSSSHPAGTKPRILIDGFPRKLDQAELFEKTVCTPELVVFLSCSQVVMEKRLLKRGETSGREDDNAASVRKRFHVFIETSLPVVHALERENKVISVQADRPIEDVYGQIKHGMGERGIHPC